MAEPDASRLDESAHLRHGREIMAELEFLDALRAYFRAEKMESVAILCGAAVLLATGAALFLGVASQFTRGLSAVLLLTGLVGAVVGGTIVLRTDRQVASLTALYETDRPRFAATEGARIERVVESFRIYRVAYAAAVLIGLVLLLIGGRPLLHGLGVGLLLFAVFGFTVDHFAEARAIAYAAHVQSVGGR